METEVCYGCGEVITGEFISMVNNFCPNGIVYHKNSMCADLANERLWNDSVMVPGIVI